jgi:hypothetical protein
MNAVARRCSATRCKEPRALVFLELGVSYMPEIHAIPGGHTPALFSVKSAYMQLAVFQLLAGGGGMGIRTPGLLIAKEKNEI